MTPTEYEHYVAAVLQAEGWDVTVTPPGRDLGLDILGERNRRRVGVQVKMYGGTGRAVNAQIVMQLLGAARYQECTDVMLVTNGRVLDNAVSVAEKLGIVIRQIRIPEGELPNGPSTTGVADRGRLTFDRIWLDHVMPLEGKVLARDNGTTNTVLVVNWAGVTRKTSNGSTQTIDIEIFRWAIERLLAGEVVLRKEINDQYPKRASSGVLLIIGSLEMFDLVMVDSKQGLRLRDER